MEKISQTDKLYNLLKPGEAVRTDTILDFVYGNDRLGLSRIGARIYDIKQKYGVEIEGWKDKNTPSLYWYRIKKDEAKVCKACKKPGFLVKDEWGDWVHRECMN